LAPFNRPAATRRGFFSSSIRVVSTDSSSDRFRWLTVQFVVRYHCCLALTRIDVLDRLLALGDHVLLMYNTEGPLAWRQPVRAD
jgi:hypothetical protein